MPTANNLRVEISRKVLHLSTSLIAFAYEWVIPDRTTMLWIVGALFAVAVLVEVFRQTAHAFHGVFARTVGFMVRDKEWNRVCGATYVLFACFLSILLFSQPVAVAVILILSVSDSAASLIGIRYGRTQFLGKSLAGSMAFFASAVVILLLLLPEEKGLAFVAAVVATLAEALPALKFGRLELSDNLLIPLCTGAVITLIQAL